MKVPLLLVRIQLFLLTASAVGFECLPSDLKNGKLILAGKGIVHFNDTTLSACQNTFTASERASVRILSFGWIGAGHDDDTKVESIAPMSFAYLDALGYTGIIEIDFTLNRIRSLEAKSFVGLSKLRSLCLIMNEIDRIEAEVPELFLNHS